MMFDRGRIKWQDSMYIYNYPGNTDSSTCISFSNHDAQCMKYFLSDSV